MAENSTPTEDALSDQLVQDSCLEILGPVAVSVVDGFDGRACETIAVGRLRTEQIADDSGVCETLFVGEAWAMPMRRGMTIIWDKCCLAIPLRSGDQFVLTMPTSALSTDMVALVTAMERLGCIVETDTLLPYLHSLVMFRGVEHDSCSADEITVETARVGKGEVLSFQVRLDERGYFYWSGGRDKKERTRPRWKDTNFVICKRVADGRRITWECYHVPDEGEIQCAPSDDLEDDEDDPQSSEAAAAKAERWAVRKKRMNSIVATGLRRLSVSAPDSAAMLAQGAGVSLEKACDEEDDPAAVAMERTAQIGKDAFVSAAFALLKLAINGKPAVGLKSALWQRNEVLRACNGDAEAASKKLVADASSFLEEAKRFLLLLVPGIGIPAALAYPMWKRLRLVCVVAAVFGHDLQEDEIQARIVYAAAGIESGGRALPKTERCLSVAVQSVWKLFAGPVTKFLPVGKIITFFADLEGKMNDMMISAFRDGPGVTEADYREQVDERASVNSFLDAAGSAALQTTTHAVFFGAEKLGVQDARQMGAKAAAAEAAGILAKKAGTAVAEKTKQWGGS